MLPDRKQSESPDMKLKKWMDSKKKVDINIERRTQICPDRLCSLEDFANLKNVTNITQTSKATAATDGHKLIVYMGEERNELQYSSRTSIYHGYQIWLHLCKLMIIGVPGL